MENHNTFFEGDVEIWDVDDCKQNIHIELMLITQWMTFNDLGCILSKMLMINFIEYCGAKYSLTSHYLMRGKMMIKK